jgi:hypothetical protein
MKEYSNADQASKWPRRAPFSSVYPVWPLPPNTCPVYPPPNTLVRDYASRPDMEWVRATVNAPPAQLDPNGVCIVPMALGCWELERNKMQWI